MKYPCPHCGKEINPASMLGSVRTEKREAAWRANGERLRKMYANARKVGEGSENLAGSSKPRTVGFEPKTRPTGGGENPSPAANADVVVQPIDKKAVFRALKAKIEGGGRLDGPGAEKIAVEAEKPLSETPCAPFEVCVEGEDHRVAQMGKRLGLYYLGGGEPSFARYLAEGELEQLWEKRKR